MSTFRTGYFRLAPDELGATVLLPPALVGSLRCEELAVWAREHGFGQIAYIPAANLRQRVAEH